MPLIATPGSADANSYLTVAEADALADQQGLGRAPQKWLKAPFDDKERALIRASREVDAYVERAGPPYLADQPLLFPRLTDVDLLGQPYIISNIRLAVFEQALYVLLNADLIDDANSRRARGLSQFADDDGSGSLLVPEPQVMATNARWHLRNLKATGRATLHSVHVRSSYAP